MGCRIRYSIGVCAIAASATTLLGCDSTLAESGGNGNVTRFEILSVESPTFGGESFGEVGQYEKIFARAHVEVDAQDRRNALITDLELAPKNDRGFVEYSTDVHIIKPVNMADGNGKIFFTVANRGNKGLGTYNGAGGNDPTTASDAGSGLLMREGFTLVWTGWEDESLRPPGDNRVLARFPIARNPDGTSVVDQTIVEHIFDTSPGNTLELVRPGVRDGLKYRPANLDESQATMLVRNHSRFVGGPLVERVEVPPGVWSYVDETTIRIDRDHEFLEPYDAGAAFEFIYPAKDPVVLGLGFAATRDVISFLRHDPSEENPLRGSIDLALATGSSQTGRYLRDFTYWGFNEDLEGRRVFEGIMPRIAGAHRIALNDRFGDTDATGRSYERELISKMEFPFTYEERTDPVSGRTDGLFARCRATSSCPKVMQLDNGNEAWLKALSLVTTDGVGNDIELPEDVRVYYFSSVQHGPASPPYETDICQQLGNPADDQPYIRALLVALDEWVTDGVLPPESQYPRVSDGTLAASLPQEGMGFPEIPGVTYTGFYIPVAVKDTTSLPNHWIPGMEYEVLVPTTDEDGNDVAGIRPVEVEVPVATYTGWGLRRAPYAENEDCGTTGQHIPFPATAAERVATGDPRLSIEERYPDHETYVAQVQAAVDNLIQQRLLLEEDAEAILEAAARSEIGRN